MLLLVRRPGAPSVIAHSITYAPFGVKFKRERKVMETRIGIIGLGYVGLPLALSFGRKFKTVVGYDIDESKLALLKQGKDPTREGFDNAISSSSCFFTSHSEDLRGVNFFVITVPTPVDKDNHPDLRAITGACEVVASVLEKGAVVVLESTVYPGLTEEFCVPLLERVSGLTHSIDFKMGYSPERVNPGDKVHTLEKIVKIVSGEDPATLTLVAQTYGAIIEAGVYQASSIKVAEAAKVIENSQRDLNIAFMNELALIFDRLGISTQEVLAAARTKWNFLPFVPGLVGGHCIGVDPYYLTSRAQQSGYIPQVILAGRKINDEMGHFVAQKCAKMLSQRGFSSTAKVGIFGLTFKENVADVRNSRVPDIYHELREYGYAPLVYDPRADAHTAFHEYGIRLCERSELHDLAAIIFAVPHREFLDTDASLIGTLVREDGIVVDIRGSFPRENLSSKVTYWCL
jgi:UDP-N-acetyl-D-glucosamine/UDP-N-acetyl-D-galactosamine dehydrogenase